MFPKLANILKKMERNTMDVVTTDYKRCSVIRTSGRIDSFNSPYLEQAFQQKAEEGRYRLVFDLSDVDFISSRGWWVLIETQKLCKRYNRGELVLVGISDEIRDSLRLVGLQKYFKMYDSVTDAVGSF
ncbi:MAG: STAS domain-containing protein [Chloroflexota bacterium]